MLYSKIISLMLSVSFMLLAIQFGLSDGRYIYCGKHTNLRYKVKAHYQGYEDRVYENTTWVSGTAAGYSEAYAKLQIVPKLWNYYYKGGNVEAMKMQGTNTMRTRVDICRGPVCGSPTFTLSYLIPYEIAENHVPEPIDGMLFIEREPVMHYAVKEDLEYRSEEDLKAKSTELARLLKSDSSIDYSHHYFVYNYQDNDVHCSFAEIWFPMKKEQQQPTNEPVSNFQLHNRSRKIPL